MEDSQRWEFLNGKAESFISVDDETMEIRSIFYALNKEDRDMYLSVDFLDMRYIEMINKELDDMEEKGNTLHFELMRKYKDCGRLEEVL